MYDKEVEPFSNPLAPPSQQVMDRKEAFKEPTPMSDSHPLTNADFRKLMMTPRATMTSGSGSIGSASVRESVRGQRPSLKAEANENRKKKKKFYATLKRQEEDTLSDLAKRYRDRARERRDDSNPDYNQDNESMATTAAYRAVAPDLKSGLDAAERRKQVIQESKFLGGDMEHTHLVKGLDYALLHKVKAEINNKEKDEKDTQKERQLIDEEEEEEEEEKPKSDKNNKKTNSLVTDKPLQADDPNAVKSSLAKNIVNVLINRQLPERNELFLAGRMAYVVDLEEEFAESDIPTTLIRSKADCPNIESMTTLSTNDIVLNKLTQILSYLRQGGVNKKTKKIKEKNSLISDDNDKSDNKTKQIKDSKGDSIYEDIEDYVPDLKRRESKNDRERDRDYRDHKVRDYRNRERERERDRSNRDKRSRNYFDKSGRQENDSRKPETRDARNIVLSGITGTGSNNISNIQIRNKSSNRLDNDVPDSYAECYPGAPENDDAILDSDDEVDYSKMDLGNKKGVVGRWDFDTAEEYGDYMSNKEALPKAAFQYGLKMADGRKTRRVTGKKEERVKLDRDLQKINAILARRKATTGESFGATPVEPKKQKTH
ncbi:protein Red-like [Oppia nitens]|uniref:protein Red-like n=1 Tax=Oppia nitens TaxID=1686743 RepID=UPI0023DA01D3|nr:protein Red-like [Oppia nitens]